MPGLAIQVANGMGLHARLEHFAGLGRKGERMTSEERVAYARPVIAE